MAMRWEIEGTMKVLTDALARQVSGDTIPGDADLIDESRSNLGTMLLCDGILDQDTLVDLLRVSRGEDAPPAGTRLCSFTGPCSFGGSGSFGPVPPRDLDELGKSLMRMEREQYRLAREAAALARRQFTALEMVRARRGEEAGWREAQRAYKLLGMVNSELAAGELAEEAQRKGAAISTLALTSSLTSGRVTGA